MVEPEYQGGSLFVTRSKDPVEYTANGHAVSCPNCHNNTFRVQRTYAETGMILEAHRSVDMLTCSECGMIQYFDEYLGE